MVRAEQRRIDWLEKNPLPFSNGGVFKIDESVIDKEK